MVPVQAPLDLAPLTTSQYLPLGRSVSNVVFQSLSELLIATNPILPVKERR